MKPDPKGSLEYFSSVGGPNMDGDTNGVAKKRPRVA
jgi:hypothetical protein